MAEINLDLEQLHDELEIHLGELKTASKMGVFREIVLAMDTLIDAEVARQTKLTTTPGASKSSTYAMDLTVSSTKMTAYTNIRTWATKSLDYYEGLLTT